MAQSQEPLLQRGHSYIAAVACHQQLRSKIRRALEGTTASCNMRVYRLSFQAARTFPAAGEIMKGFRVCFTMRCDWGMSVCLAGMDDTDTAATGWRRGVLFSLMTQ